MPDSNSSSDVFKNSETVIQSLIDELVKDLQDLSLTGEHEGYFNLLKHPEGPNKIADYWTELGKLRKKFSQAISSLEGNPFVENSEDKVAELKKLVYLNEMLLIRRGLVAIHEYKGQMTGSPEGDQFQELATRVTEMLLALESNSELFNNDLEDLDLQTIVRLKKTVQRSARESFKYGFIPGEPERVTFAEIRDGGPAEEESFFTDLVTSFAGYVNELPDGAPQTVVGVGLADMTLRVAQSLANDQVRAKGAGITRKVALLHAVQSEFPDDIRFSLLEELFCQYSKYEPSLIRAFMDAFKNEDYKRFDPNNIGSIPDEKKREHILTELSRQSLAHQIAAEGPHLPAAVTDHVFGPQSR